MASSCHRYLMAFLTKMVIVLILLCSFLIRESEESRRFIKGLLLGALISRAGGGHTEHIPHYYPLPYYSGGFGGIAPFGGK